MPLNDRNAPRSRQRARLVGTTGEAVEHRARRARPRARRMSNVSSHASRVWITSGEVALVGQRRSARRTRRAARRGASGRSGSRGRTRRRHDLGLVEQRRRCLSTPSLASWGCNPTVAHTPSCAGRDVDRHRGCASASVPIVIMRSTPAARAAAIAAAAPPSNRSSSRWQWLSVQRHDADQVAGHGDAAGRAARPSRPASPPG